MDGITCLTFDCYGTLIDWDRGIRGAALEIASLAECDLDLFLRDRERLEGETISGPYKPYDEVLAESLGRAAERQGRKVSAAEAESFAASMSNWVPFPDSIEALAGLRECYRLGILSNVRTSVLESSVAKLGVEFDVLVTAEEIESYKPAHKHFDEGLARLGLCSDEVLHVAGSLWHDIRPALDLGWRCAWIDRRGEGLPGDVAPTWVAGSLAELAREL